MEFQYFSEILLLAYFIILSYCFKPFKDHLSQQTGKHMVPEEYLEADVAMEYRCKNYISKASNILKEAKTLEISIHI
jgi:hypothetical protein